MVRVVWLFGFILVNLLLWMMGVFVLIAVCYAECVVFWMVMGNLVCCHCF